MVYNSKRERAHGAVRTTVYNSGTRVDDVQHNLMGILTVLDTFAAEDSRT